MDNLCVRIQNIHIRLEDRQQKVIKEYEADGVSVRTQEQSTCIGLTLRELKLEAVPAGATLDEDGVGDEKAWLTGSDDEIDESPFQSAASQQPEDTSPSLNASDGNPYLGKASSSIVPDDLE